MRSMKSILGSTLAQQSTEVGAGRSVRYLDVVGGYLRHLKRVAEAEAGHELTRLVLGRPVFFVDDDAQRDAEAQAVLLQAAREAGFADIRLQYEPIAAALNYETTVAARAAGAGGRHRRRHLGLLAGARRAGAAPPRRAQGRHPGQPRPARGRHRLRPPHRAGLHPARAAATAASGPTGREVPSKVYFDLATWHLINTVYVPGRVAELSRMKSFYADPQLHARLMTVVHARLGHALVAQAEAAKIAVAEGGDTTLDLGAIDAGLQVRLPARQAIDALQADLQRIVDAADETLRQAGVARERVDALYFTGGSTGLAPLAQRIAARFPAASGGARRPFRQRRAGPGRARAARVRRDRADAAAAALRSPRTAHQEQGHGGHGLRLGRQRLHRRLPDPPADAAGLERAHLGARPGARAGAARAAGRGQLASAGLCRRPDARRRLGRGHAGLQPRGARGLAAARQLGEEAGRPDRAGARRRAARAARRPLGGRAPLRHDLVGGGHRLRPRPRRAPLQRGRLDAQRLSRHLALHAVQDAGRARGARLGGARGRRHRVLQHQPGGGAGPGVGARTTRRRSRW